MTRRPQWRWFGLWVVAGAAWALAALTGFTIGIFVAPFALALTVALSTRRSVAAGWPGAVAGLGLPSLYVAWLNRHGPAANACHPIRNGESCTQLFDPKPWLAVAVFFAVLGSLTFVALRRASA
jgi:hypothetical protein